MFATEEFLAKLEAAGVTDSRVRSIVAAGSVKALAYFADFLRESKALTPEITTLLQEDILAANTAARETLLENGQFSWAVDLAWQVDPDTLKLR